MELFFPPLGKAVLKAPARPATPLPRLAWRLLPSLSFNDAEIPLKEADRLVVESIRSGDADAFAALYRQHFRRIMNFALRRLGDPSEAEDVVQEVFEAVYHGLDRFEGKSDLVVWIYGITRNLLNNRLRKRGGVRLVSIDDVPPEAGPIDLGPEPLAQARQVLGRVQAAIRDLPTEQRKILELRHGRRLSIRRVAQLTGRTEDAVKSSLYRARRSLSAALPGQRLAL